MFPFRVFQNHAVKPQSNTSNPQRVPVPAQNMPKPQLPNLSSGYLPSRSFGTEVNSYSSLIDNIQYKELSPFVYQRIEEDRLAKKQERERLEMERRERLHEEQYEAMRTQEVKVKESIELLQEVVPKLQPNELNDFKANRKKDQRRVEQAGIPRRHSPTTLLKHHCMPTANN